MSAAGSNPAPSAERDLLGAAELEGDRVVDEVVQPLHVVLEVGLQPTQLQGDRLGIEAVEDAGGQGADPGLQLASAAVRGHLAGGEPGLAVTGTWIGQGVAHRGEPAPEVPAPLWCGGIGGEHLTKIPDRPFERDAAASRHPDLPCTTPDWS